MEPAGVILSVTLPGDAQEVATPMATSRAGQRRDQTASRRRRIFANENSVLRLAGAVLLEIHDEWAVAERCYLSAGSLAKLCETRRDDDPKEVEGAHSELVA
jgi:hypothetical protein